MRAKSLLVAGLLAASLAPGPALAGDDGGGEQAAEAGDTSEQLVYYPLVTDGVEYRRVFYPQEVDTIRVLAGHDVVLEARHSIVSFWPITREYLPDFERKDERVSGTIEVTGPDGRIRHIEPTPYTLWYPKGITAGEAEVVAGEAAHDRYEQYRREAIHTAEQMRDYQERIARHQAEVDAWLDKAAEGVEPLPDPPEEFDEPPPEASEAFSTEVSKAPILNLPAGTYTLRMLDAAGDVVAGSERRVESFEPEAEAIGYYVLPKERWTQPTVSFDPEQSLYIAREEDIFLQPVLVKQYDAYRYARLFEPQTVEASDPSHRVWVPEGPLEGSEQLRAWLRRAGREVATVPERPYRVRQMPDRVRGYTIEEFDEDGALEPDFRAMRLPTGAEPISHVTLVSADGSVLANSGRDVRYVDPVPRGLVYAPAALPLVLFLVARRGRGRLRKLVRQR